MGDQHPSKRDTDQMQSLRRKEFSWKQNWKRRTSLRDKTELLELDAEALLA